MLPLKTEHKMKFTVGLNRWGYSMDEPEYYQKQIFTKQTNATLLILMFFTAQDNLHSSKLKKSVAIVKGQDA